MTPPTPPTPAVPWKELWICQEPSSVEHLVGWERKSTSGVCIKQKLSQPFLLHSISQLPTAPSGICQPPMLGEQRAQGKPRLPSLQVGVPLAAEPPWLPQLGAEADSEGRGEGRPPPSPPGAPTRGALTCHQLYLMAPHLHVGGLHRLREEAGGERARVECRGAAQATEPDASLRLGRRRAAAGIAPAKGRARGGSERQGRRQPAGWPSNARGGRIRRRRRQPSPASSAAGRPPRPRLAQVGLPREGIQRAECARGTRGRLPDGLGWAPCPKPPRRPPLRARPTHQRTSPARSLRCRAAPGQGCRGAGSRSSAGAQRLATPARGKSEGGCARPGRRPA